MTAAGIVLPKTKKQMQQKKTWAHLQKPLGKQLRGQFLYKNIPNFCLAVFAALAAGSLNLILSWIIQQLMDTAAGKSGALSFRTLLLISAGFVLLCAGLSLLNYASQPRFWNGQCGSTRILHSKS